MALLNWATAPNHQTAYEGCGGPGALLELNPSGDSVYLSEDGGVTWPEYSLPTMGGGWSKPFYSWQLALYIVFNYNGDGTQYATSPDGKVWTQRTFPVDTYGSVFIREGDGLLVVIYSGVFWYSSDAITWASTTPPSGNDIAFGNGYWVVPSASSPDLGGNHLHYCMALGDAWTSVDFPGMSIRANRICFANGFFLAPSNTANVLKRFATPVGAVSDQGLPSGLVIANAADVFDNVQGDALSLFVFMPTGLGLPVIWSPTGLSDSWESYSHGLNAYSFMWNRTLAYVLGDTGSIISALEAPLVPVTITDGIAMGDSPLTHPVKIVLDGVVFTGDAHRLYTAVLRARAALNSTQSAQFDGSLRASDTVALGDRLAYVIHVMVQEGLVLNGTAVGQNTAFVRVVSLLLMQGIARNVAEAVVQITDGLVLSAAILSMGKAEVTDAVAMRAVMDSLYTAVGRLIDRLAMSATAAGVFTAMAIVSDSVAMGAEPLHYADLIAAVRDGAAFATTITIDNFEYIAWVMNTQTKAVWRYTDYPFNSFAKVNGRYYGATSTGLYDLHEDTDDGEDIAWRMRLGMSAAGTRREKRYAEAYIAIRSTGEVFLKTVVIDEATGDKHACIYRMVHRNTNERRQRVGRGLCSVEWDWELAGTGTMELTGLQFRPLLLDRRTRG